MNKSFPFSITVYLMAVFCIVPGLSRSQDITGKWTGTMSMEIITRYEFGSSTTRVYLTITENVVTGTVESSSRAVIEGKERASSSCSGEGTGELWRVAFSSDGNTYDLQAISPVVNCTHRDYILGITEVKKMENGLDLIVDSHPMGANRNVLTGTKTETGDMAGIGTATTTITWNLYSGPLDAYLIIKPIGYDTWKPEATPDELRKGNSMNIELSVQGRNGGNPSFKAVRFELRLTNTSIEPGTTLNAPLLPSPEQLPDIRFIYDLIGESLGKDQYIEFHCEDGKTGKATIASYDGGGWTTMTAVAVLEGGIRIEGTLLNPRGVKEIPIPKRKPGSNIASSWLAQYGNLVDTADHELPDGHAHKGDGLSAYEEYRGVISEGKYKKLNPLVKELGIWGNEKDLNLFGHGITMFKNATKIEPVKFYDLEIEIERRLNNNASYANVCKQFALWIHPGNVRETDARGNPIIVLGIAVNGPDIPENIPEIIIDTGLINSNFRDLSSTNQEAGLPMLYSEKDNLGRTVAHEISHGVNVPHHGLSNLNAPREDSVTVDGVPTVNAWDINGRILRPPTHISGDIGKPQGLQSGDLDCFMSYSPFYDWALHDHIVTRKYYQVKDLTVGTKMCRSPGGTSINVNGKYFGDAKAGRGNCLGRIKFK